MSEEADGPWLDMSAYPNLEPEDAVPDDVLGVLRDVLRAPGVEPLHPDAWQAVLHDATAPPDHGAGSAPGEAHQPAAHEPGTPDAAHDHETHEHETQDGHWPAPHEGDQTWHGPGTGLDSGTPGAPGDHGANGPRDDGMHDGGQHDAGGH
jgi:hypothetical protein